MAGLQRLPSPSNNILPYQAPDSQCPALVKDIQMVHGVNSMQTLAFVNPITPGKTEEWKSLSEELAGPRQSEYKASRKRLGMTTERAYYQQTPMGDMAVIYIEAEDIQRVFEGLATSQDPFDVWFRGRVKDLFSGTDLTQQPPPYPPPTLIFDGLTG